MLPDDLMRRQLMKQVAAVLNIVGSILTDEQAILLGIALENQRREVITTSVLMNQPPQSMRSFPMVQLLPPGKPREFSVEAHGITVLICQALARAARDSKFRDDLFGVAREDLRKGGLNLATRAYYEADALKGAGAKAIAELGAVISPQELFTTIGASPARYGSGFMGEESIKGRMSTTYGSAVETRQERHSIGDMIRSVGGAFEEGE